MQVGETKKDNMLDFWPGIPGVTYKSIINYPFYCVGDNGFVWSHHGRRKAKPTPDWYLLQPCFACNYIRVCLSNEFGPKWLLVHRLVLEAFVGPCPPGMECCHGKLGSYNNSLENLRWDTRINNMKDQAIMGTRPKGENHYEAIVSNEDIPIIRKRYWSGESSEAIGRDYMLARSTIDNIAHSRRWTHIK